MNVKVASRKLIKPCIPTPQNLNKYKLSFLDELSPRMEVGVLLFYSAKPKSMISGRLEKSLAQVLVQFYPLAGRYINKDHFVNCSDQGAEFVEAQGIGVELTDVVSKTTTLEQLNGFLPRNKYEQEEDEALDPLLSIQITELKCGGLVIGISISHRIFDASSLGTFVASWSNACNPGRGWSKISISPTLDSYSFFPGRNRNNNLPDVKPTSTETPPPPPKTVVKRFSFNKEAITSLRLKLMPKDGKGGITRVRVVCALIAEVLIGVDRLKHGRGEESRRRWLIAQAVNMRERTIPPLPKHSCGNLAILSLTPCMAAKDMGIQELVRILGDSIDKSIADCAEILSVDDDGLNNIIVNPVVDAFEKSVSGETNVIWFSDWSKFGFYEADFGWGKPVWASIIPPHGENMTVLMDNKEGHGLEAWVQLNHMDMSYFEQDEDIRSYATNLHLE